MFFCLPSNLSPLAHVKMKEIGTYINHSTTVQKITNNQKGVETNISQTITSTDTTKQGESLSNIK